MNGKLDLVLYQTYIMFGLGTSTRMDITFAVVPLSGVVRWRFEVFAIEDAVTNFGQKLQSFMAVFFLG